VLGDINWHAESDVIQTLKGKSSLELFEKLKERLKAYSSVKR
jgi:hypothetical protein